MVGLIVVGALHPAPAQLRNRLQHPTKRLVADYGYWSKYQDPAYGAAQIPFDKLTEVIHAGLSLNGSADGTITVPNGFIEPLLVKRAHGAGVKVLVLLGGSAQTFSAVAGDRETRLALVRNLSAFASANVSGCEKARKCGAALGMG